MPRTIKPRTLRFRLAQLCLRALYGKSPDPAGWHFYPVRQASSGAFIVCLHKGPGGYSVGLSRRAGKVEGAGLYSVTLGGFVDLARGEQPDEAACREAREESSGAITLTPDRLTCLFSRFNYHEVKHWHTDHTTQAVAFFTVLTDAEQAALAASKGSDESAGVIFVPLATALADYGPKIAYAVERTALERLATRHA